MSKDYKPNPERPKKVNKGSPFLTGLLVGFLLGVAASLSVVVFIKGGENPFTLISKPGKPLAEKIIEDQKNQIQAPDEAGTTTDQNQQNENTPPKEDGTRFDFYNILPESAPKQDAKDDTLKENATPADQATIYYLQIGAYRTAEEADNIKANLALQGFEAVVQTAPYSDKGIWHRVRVGPLKNFDQISKVKADLLNNGFKADLVKDLQQN
ncbi:MAG: SPOR domain-containing protein [Betaproteobacteria bacterium]|nr:SPOR domain-containing protein [Betaproteobacteria bacterium]